ncbi:MAG: M61 family metallopeptidase [Chthonomonadales bacterium]|nr:M61 family metallopeptidase [Chthonomonadales bacterium]
MRRIPATSCLDKNRRPQRSVAAATLCVAAILVTAACAVQPPSVALRTSTIRYTLEPIPATADREGLTRVRISVPVSGEAPTALRLRMPVWTPGEYRVQNHARYVRRVRTAEGSDAIQRPDPHTWVIPAYPSAPCTVEYELVNAPPGVFTENVDVRSRRAFYNGAATFMYVDGRKDEPAVLSITVPRGWTGPITTLRAAASSTEPPAFAAADYDELADAPILVGEANVGSFDLGGKSHTVAMFGQTRGTTPAPYVATLQSVARAAQAYMESLPYPSYTLFLDMGGRGGGLEHANGARIAWQPWMDSRQLGRFLAHEYFHLWNVKRIRPEALGPFDYQKPPRTRNLWFCEGVTEYVAGLLALRARILDERTYLNDLARSITTLANTPARKRITAEEASLRIWEDGRSTGYGGLSVYLKGEMIGLCLDLELLRITDGRFGMRELMRDLMERHAPPRPGYPEDGLRQAVVRAGGPSMGPYYDRLCRTTDELPIAEALRAAGLRLTGDGYGDYGISAEPEAAPSTRRVRESWLYGR